MPFGGLLSIGVGTAMGAAKAKVAADKAARDRTLAAKQIELSPYTGRTKFQDIQDPNWAGEIVGGAEGGMKVASGMGAFKKPMTTETTQPEVTGTSSGGYGGANLGMDYSMPKMTSLQMSNGQMGSGMGPNQDELRSPYFNDPYRRFTK